MLGSITRKFGDFFNFATPYITKYSSEINKKLHPPRKVTSESPRTIKTQLLFL